MISSPATNLKMRVGQDSVVPWLFSLPAILMLLAFLVTPFVLAVISRSDRPRTSARCIG